MALLAFPPRKRSAGLSDRLTDYRLVRDVREGLHDLPSRVDLPLSALPASLPNALPALTDLVEAVIEAGTKHSPLRVSVRRPRRKRRAAGVMLLVAAVGGLVLAYRWWQKRDQDAAGLLDEPDSDDGPTTMTPPPNPWADTTPRSEPDAPSASADGPRASLAVEAEACEEAPSDAPKPWVAPRRAETLRPREAGRASTVFGRGPSVAAPAVPASRPAVPDRPAPHLPR